jgi:hypothetical protein
MTRAGIGPHRYYFIRKKFPSGIDSILETRNSPVQNLRWAGGAVIAAGCTHTISIERAWFIALRRRLPLVQAPST